MIDKIQQYWNDRAGTSAGARTATTDDVHLRDLEVSKILWVLEPRLRGLRGATILDLGCGDGDTTLRIAEALPGVRVRGIDYAPKMIDIANERLLETSLRDRVSFGVGDATALARTLPDRFAAVVTCRVLINLPDPASQYDVLGQIAQVLLPGGTYVGTENFMDGQRNLNSARATMGLPEIGVRWHNLFFERDALLAELARHFSDVQLEDFASSYYFATRVVYSAMCQMRGEKPDYDHEIHRLAPKLPVTGRFSPVQLIVASTRRNADG